MLCIGIILDCNNLLSVLCAFVARYKLPCNACSIWPCFLLQQHDYYFTSLGFGFTQVLTARLSPLYSENTGVKIFFTEIMALTPGITKVYYVQDVELMH